MQKYSFSLLALLSGILTSSHSYATSPQLTAGPWYTTATYDGSLYYIITTLNASTWTNEQKSLVEANFWWGHPDKAEKLVNSTYSNPQVNFPYAYGFSTDSLIYGVQVYQLEYDLENKLYTDQTNINPGIPMQYALNQPALDIIPGDAFYGGFMYSTWLGGPLNPSFNGGTLRLYNSSGNQGASVLNFAQAFAVNASADGPNTIDAYGNSANFTGAFTGAGGLAFSNSTYSSGAPSIITVNALSYSGPTTVNSGVVLQAGQANAFSASSAMTLNSGATLALNNYNQTIGSLAGVGSTLLGSATLTTGGDNSSTSYIGTMTGTGGLTKVGSGTMTVGSLAFTGLTNVNAGTLALTNGSSIASAVNVANAATFNNSGTTNGIVTNSCGGTVNNSGVMANSVNNSGVLTNSGSINGTVKNNSNCGAVNNTTGTLAGAVSNSGTLTNALGGTISGALTNNAGGVTTNAGQITNTVSNSGTFTNSLGGAITSAVTNAGGAQFTNNGSIAANVTSNGAFTNASGAGIGGTFFNDMRGVLTNRGTLIGAVTNNGTATNYGTLSSALTNAGSFDNKGLISQAIANSGTFTNSGTASNSVTNSGTATNTVGGVINGSVNNNASTSQFTNSGRIYGDATNALSAQFTNGGSIGGNAINNGILTNASGAEIIGTFLNATTGTLTNRGTISSAVTNNGSATNYGTLSSTLANDGTFDNRGLISLAITNLGTFTNSGTASNSVTNSGAATNTVGGVIGGSVNNNSASSQFTNKGRIYGDATNAQSAQFTNSGSIGGNATNNGVFANDSGAEIIGTFLNSGTGTLTNRGTIGGVVTNNGSAANSGTIQAALTNANAFDNAGLVSGAVTNTGTFTNTGTINNTVNNTGILNLNGTFGRVTGAISGNGVINVGGRFVQEAAINNNTINVNDRGLLVTTNSLIAPAINVNAGGYLLAASNISAPITISDRGVLANDGNRTVTGSITNSGNVMPLSAGDKLSVNGAYTQTATGKFTTPIASTTKYGTLESTTAPLSIASGSSIVALMDPHLRIGPGTVFQAVLKGTATPVQNDIRVFTDTPRYKLKAVWAGDQVNLEYLGTYYGALTKQTLYSLSPLQGSTLNALHQRYAVLNAVMEYDCNKFDKHNFCISAEARGTGFGSQATGAGVFNIAYRPTEKTRVGAYLDYQVTAGNPATNPQPVAGTLSSGSVNYGYDSATFGGYLGYSETGYTGRFVNKGVQAFVSGGFNPGKIQTSRALTLDPYGFDFVDSQPGSGTASLNAYYGRGMLGYGYGLTEQATLMPYLGVRYTNVSRGGYMEGFNALVTQPLVFNAFYERLVTGFGGMLLNGQLTDRLGVTAGLGAELDFTRSASSYSGYSPLAIQDSLFAFGFQHGGAWNGFRPTGTLGAYYDVMPNQRVSLNGYVGQQAFTTRTFTSTLLGYQVAF